MSDPDPLFKDDVPQELLHASLAVSCRSDILANYVSRILDAVIWDRDNKKATEAYEELKAKYKRDIDQAYMEGKASSAPDNAIKVLRDTLTSIENTCNRGSAALMHIQTREKKNDKGC